MNIVNGKICGKVMDIHYSDYLCGREQMHEVYLAINIFRYQLEDIPQQGMSGAYFDLKQMYSR